MEKAIFAAGCFWGVQYYFDQVPGVIKTTAGYSGGHTTNPNWYNTHEDDTGHAEAVLMEFDPQKVSYETLVRHFFRMHNPTLLNSDGINVGENYRSAIFYFDDRQKAAAEAIVLQKQKDFKDPIVTQITKASEFYPAEDYHQKYTEKTGNGMCHVTYQPI